MPNLRCVTNESIFKEQEYLVSAEALYMQDEPEIVPLRCIQTEETAMKELSELYGAQASAASQSTAAEPIPPPGNKKSRPRSRKSDSRKDDHRRDGGGSARRRTKAADGGQESNQAQPNQGSGRQSREKPRHRRRKESPRNPPVSGQERKLQAEHSSATQVVNSTG